MIRLPIWLKIPLGNMRTWSADCSEATLCGCEAAVGWLKFSWPYVSWRLIAPKLPFVVVKLPSAGRRHILALWLLVGWLLRSYPLWLWSGFRLTEDLMALRFWAADNSEATLSGCEAVVRLPLDRGPCPPGWRSRPRKDPWRLVVVGGNVSRTDLCGFFPDKLAPFGLSAQPFVAPTCYRTLVFLSGSHLTVTHMIRNFCLDTQAAGSSAVDFFCSLSRIYLGMI